MAERRVDEYQPLNFYKKHSIEKTSGFSKFEVDGAYYFCRYIDGKIGLISQAYVGESGRDNGIESVTKNSKLKKRYSFEDRPSGKYGFSLKAGNHQEIAISPDFTSRKQAEHVAGRMSGSVKAAAKPKATKKTAVKKKAPTKAKTAAKASAAVAAGAAFTAADGRRGNYKPLAFYKKHGGSKDGFNRFEVDGAHYFSYYKDGKIALISEAYTSASGRDNGIESVKKNKPIGDRYRYRKHKNGKHYFDLVAGNSQEIATSPWYSSEKTNLAAADRLRRRKRRTKTAGKAAAGVAAAGLTAAAASKASAKPKAKTTAPSHPPVKKVTPAVAPVIDPAPVMAKPAKPVVSKPVVKAPVAAAPAVAAAAAAASTPDVEVVQRSGLPGWLKWLLLLLLALLAMFLLFKMCDKETATPPPALVACWDGSEAKNQSACPTKVTCWDDSFAVSEDACPAQPIKLESEPEPTPEPVTYTCWDGSSVTDLANCPAEPSFTCWDGSTVRDQSNCPVRPAPVRSSATATSLFTAPAVSPINVTRLGSNPEFGDSHALTPSGFCDKLATQYAVNEYDAKYLNYLARELGYSNFEAMPNSACSNATLDYGTTGILGYGSQHGLQYSTLNVTDARDLEAFQITGANGRVVYFMKTCGNYFYPTN